ncbi:response regulator transcription factor [bacterium]|nr:MAG: response regulator transcription factor [bacterium]
MKPVIAVIEDDPAQRQMMLEFLGHKGCEAHGAENGQDGVALVVKLRPNLVILDLQLPGLDGFGVCRLLKADRRTRSVPILILTANATPENHLSAVQFAADHFLAKPVVDFEEFHRWVRALLARAPAVVAGRVVAGGVLVLDPEAHTAALVGSDPVALPPKLFAILSELARRPGEVLDRTYFIDRVWHNAVRDREVDVAVSRLRTLLGPKAGAALVSVPGRGYRLDLAKLAA